MFENLGKILRTRFEHFDSYSHISYSYLYNKMQTPQLKCTKDLTTGILNMRGVKIAGFSIGLLSIYPTSDQSIFQFLFCFKLIQMLNKSTQIDLFYMSI